MIWRNWILATVSAGLSLLLLESAARVWVRVRWPLEKAHQLTHATETRGRFATHPKLGYSLTPGFTLEGFSHSSLGFRGPELAHVRRPEFRRLAILGASTVYGIYVSDQETSAAQLQSLLSARGVRTEVLNAGVPGWNSRETLLNWRVCVAHLRPDVAVVIDGRNEAFPQLWEGYRPDYGHYRDLAYQVVNSNLAHKRWFRISHLAMVLITKGQLLGFSRAAEHPLYGSIRFDNLPTPERAARYASEPARALGYEANLRSLTARMRAAGTVPVLVTIPFWKDGYRSGVLKGQDGFLEAVTTRVRANNELVRRVARESGIPVVEGEDLSGEQFLFDDCHLRPEGERLLAERILTVVLPLLDRPPTRVAGAMEPETWSEVRARCAPSGFSAQAPGG